MQLPGPKGLGFAGFGLGVQDSVFKISRPTRKNELWEGVILEVREALKRLQAISAGTER